MNTLLLVPLEDVVVFPNMTLSLAVDTGDEERVLLVPRHGGEFAGVGTVAEVVERSRRGVVVTGLHRGVAGAAVTDADGQLRVEVEERPDEEQPRSAPPSSSASTAPSSRRSSSCAMPTSASPRSCGRSRAPARWPTPPATRPT